MKRILILMIVFMTTVDLFSQYGGALANFSKKPLYVELDELIAKEYNGTFPVNDKRFNDFIERRAYCFYENDKLYILSYSWDKVYDGLLKMNYYLNFDYLGEKKEREIYLYRYDGNMWKKASDVIKTDYYMCDKNNIYSYDYYYPYKDGFDGAIDNGYIKKLQSGYVAIRLTSLRNSNTADPNIVPTFYNETFLLKSNGNGTYSLQNELSFR